MFPGILLFKACLPLLLPSDGNGHPSPKNWGLPVLPFVKPSGAGLTASCPGTDAIRAAVSAVMAAGTLPEVAANFAELEDRWEQLKASGASSLLARRLPHRWPAGAPVRQDYSGEL